MSEHSEHYSVDTVGSDRDVTIHFAVENAAVGFYIIDHGRFEYINAHFAELLGCEREELIGTNRLDWVLPEDRARVEELTDHQTPCRPSRIDYAFRGATKSGETRSLHAYESRMDEGGRCITIGALIDETDTVQSRIDLEKSARYDELTSLFNRYAFLHEFNRALTLARRQNHHVALLLFDLDNFKQINDSLGHQAGDRALVEMARRVSGILRTPDIFARIGGDEFVVILEAYKSVDEVTRLVQRIQKAMEESYFINGFTIHLSLSIGIALYPEHGDDAEVLQRAADLAMYKAKISGKNRHAFFDSNSDTLIGNIRLEHDLEKGIAEDQFRLYLQPQIDIASDAMYCAEALVRWEHPTEGLLLPERFLPIAREAGLLHRIDQRMIEKSFALLERWAVNYPVPSRVTINISNALFHHHQFLPFMQTMQERYGDLCRYVELELTEDVLTGNLNYADRLTRSLKRLGFHIAIDNFGTGDSSLRYLKQLDVAKLKIDYTFISEITHNDRDRAFVEAIIVLGRTLDLDVVAEGVEYRAQIEALKQMGCNMAQGFYFSQVLSIEDFEKRWLKKV